MLNTTTNWTKIYQDITDRYGEDLDDATLMRSANRVLDDIKNAVSLPTQIRVARIPYVYEFEKYTLPTDFKTEGQISLRYNDETDNDRNKTFIIDEPPFLKHNVNWKFLIPSEWNSRNRVDSACIQPDKGIEKLFLANGRASQTNQEINACDSLTGWTGASGIGSVELDDDTSKKTEGDYSIKFALTAVTAGTLTLALATAVDLSDYTSEDVIMLDLWTPTAPTSIEVRIGSSSSAYYSQSITTQADGSAFDTIRKNEIRFEFSEATKTGSPDMENADYFQVILNFASATTDTDFHIDNIKAWQVEWLDFEYYSFFLVMTENSVWQEYIVNSSDIILLLNSWRGFFEEGILVRSGLLDGDSRITTWEKNYNNWLEMLPRQFPNRKKLIGHSWW